jgi:large subunit ribosomal protein L22
MEVKAKISGLRIAPKKVRLVCDVIRGLDVQEAQSQLQFIVKKSALPILKLLNSALANAENNFKIKKDNLYIKKIFADEGPKLKRWRPRAFGRAAPILKRSSHITIILEEKKPTKTGVKAKKFSKEGKVKKDELEVVTKEELKKESALEKKEEVVKRERKPFISIKEIKDRFIRRSGEK